jgi:hypothetical protein
MAARTAWPAARRAMAEVMEAAMQAVLSAAQQRLAA